METNKQNRIIKKVSKQKTKPKEKLNETALARNKTVSATYLYSH